MYGNYYDINIEQRERPLTKEFCKDMRSLVRAAKARKIRCAFVHDEKTFTLKFTGGDEEPLDFDCNCYKGLGITDCGGLRTHPGDNNFDSAVKAGLVVCLKHGVIDRWSTDGSEQDSEWQLAKEIVQEIGIDTELYRPLTSLGENGFMRDIPYEKGVK